MHINLNNFHATTSSICQKHVIFFLAASTLVVTPHLTSIDVMRRYINTTLTLTSTRMHMNLNNFHATTSPIRQKMYSPMYTENLDHIRAPQLASPPSSGAKDRTCGRSGPPPGSAQRLRPNRPLVIENDIPGNVCIHYILAEDAHNMCTNK